MKYGKDCNASGLYLRHKKVIPFSGGVLLQQRLLASLAYLE
jgi:hypothetical protein